MTIDSNPVQLSLIIPISRPIQDSSYRSVFSLVCPLVVTSVVSGRERLGDPKSKVDKNSHQTSIRISYYY